MTGGDEPKRLPKNWNLRGEGLSTQGIFEVTDEAVKETGVHTPSAANLDP
jgi:hypothetical protein